jgi:ferritin-like metal-binding protein YciE
MRALPETFSDNNDFAGVRTMGLFTHDIQTFDDLFVHQLQDIYYAENQITKALPKMIDKATAPELRQGFETHLRETEGQIDRLERVFGMLDLEIKGTTCPAIEGIIKEANEVAGEIADKEVLDAALVASAQAVEHYEITRYGTLIAWAQLLGRDDVAQILDETLAEEKATDEKLNQISIDRINRRAAAHQSA